MKNKSTLSQFLSRKHHYSIFICVCMVQVVRKLVLPPAVHMMPLILFHLPLIVKSSGISCKSIDIRRVSVSYRAARRPDICHKIDISWRPEGREKQAGPDTSYMAQLSTPKKNNKQKTKKNKGSTRIKSLCAIGSRLDTRSDSQHSLKKQICFQRVRLESAFRKVFVVFYFFFLSVSGSSLFQSESFYIWGKKPTPTSSTIVFFFPPPRPFAAVFISFSPKSRRRAPDSRTFPAESRIGLSFRSPRNLPLVQVSQRRTVGFHHAGERGIVPRRSTGKKSPGFQVFVEVLKASSRPLMTR